MKKPAVLIFFFFILQFAKSTDWFPVGAQWHWGYINYCCGPPPYYNGYFKWNAVKDTIVDGKSCAIVEDSSYRYPFEPLWHYRYVYYQDSDKIYRFNDDKFLPVYDFTKLPGDTVTIVTDSGLYTCDTFYFIIDSITPLLQDSSLQVQHGVLKNKCYQFGSFDYLHVIEKVGYPNLYTRNTYLITDGPVYYPRCYDDSFTSIKLVDYGCDEIIDDVGQRWNRENIKIFPNPALDKISVALKKITTIEWSVLNLSGQIIKEGKADHLENISVDISAIPNGMYLLKIKSEEEVLTEKILIAH